MSLLEHIEYVKDARYDNYQKRWVLTAVVRELNGRRIDKTLKDVIVDSPVLNQAMKKAYFKGVEKGENNSNQL